MLHAGQEFRSCWAVAGATWTRALVGQQEHCRIALQGHQPFSAAVQAVYNTLKALQDVQPSALTGVASADMMAKVTRAGEYKSWTDDFLS